LSGDERVNIGVFFRSVCRSIGVVCCALVVVGDVACRICVKVCEIVGASQHSRAGGRQLAIGIRCGVFRIVCRAGSWKKSRRWLDVYVFNRRIYIKLKFLVGLVVGVR